MSAVQTISLITLACGAALIIYIAAWLEGWRAGQRDAADQVADLKRMVDDSMVVSPYERDAD